METNDSFRDPDAGKSQTKRLCEALHETSTAPDKAAEKPERHLIGLLPGEGVGPELIRLVQELLEIVASRWELEFDFRTGGTIGDAAEKTHGVALTEDVTEFCDSIFRDDGVLLCGPGGGRFVYELRQRFDLFCKFTPIQPVKAVQDTGCLRPETVEDVDMIVVRDNTGGLYFSEGTLNDDEAVHTYRNERKVIERIIKVAIRLAQQRRGGLTLPVKKAAIREASQLWTKVFEELTRGRGLETRILEIDNTNYQIIADARSFDVVVAPNMFGDLLSDGAALLLGSRGMSFSGNFSDAGQMAFQTAHGSAHDLAGSDTANPVGQILSTAMLLREAYQLFEPAAAIEAAVEQILASGLRTQDIATPGCRIVGTRELARAINAFVREGSIQKSPLS